ncbi:DUF1642 domain-containing protein [Lactococcus lactis subsp. lactis]|uniref:DUF1642 domain-containing protein n=1 Tax=Lactococcus lactis TaxID=1358 RepID=UPI0020786393|nr:DUF1642 domain-containing protein [Lactococcus lactis]USI62157.1 DUF1642 domain-containing protein [Lactococcus lactis subsp. lactis]
MTKFEEEVKRPANGPLTELNNNMKEVFSQYRKMRQYADYLEYELKQKNEHILKLENENSFMRDERTTFDSNGNSVEPIIPQQSLLVVPECVAELFNEYRLENIQRLFEFGIDDIKSNKMIKALMWRDKHPDTFSLAFITGKYEVEKPQLFYIDLPKVFGLSDSTGDSTFVSKAEGGTISEFTKGKDYALKLTEQEIKSIDERYWQFAVPVEDGE